MARVKSKPKEVLTCQLCLKMTKVQTLRLLPNERRTLRLIDTCAECRRYITRKRLVAIYSPILKENGA